MYVETTEQEVEARVRDLAPLVKRIAHHMMASLPPSEVSCPPAERSTASYNPA